MALYEIRRRRPGPFDRIDKKIESIVTTIWEDISKAVTTNNDTVRALRNKDIEWFTEGTSNLLDTLTWVITTLNSPTEDGAIEVHRNIQTSYQPISSDLQAIVDDLHEISVTSSHVSFLGLEDSIRKIKALLDWQGNRIQDNLSRGSQLLQATVTRFLYSSVAGVLRILAACLQVTDTAQAPPEEQRLVLSGTITDTASYLFCQLFRDIGDLLTYIEGRFQTLKGFSKNQVTGWIKEELEDTDSELRSTLNGIIDDRIEAAGGVGPGGEGEEVTIPEEYITETELTDKLKDYVKKAEGEEEGFKQWRKDLQEGIKFNMETYKLPYWDFGTEQMVDLNVRKIPDTLRDYIDYNENMLNHLTHSLAGKAEEEEVALPGTWALFNQLLRPIFE